MGDDRPAPRKPLSQQVATPAFVGLCIAAGFYLLTLLMISTFEKKNPEDGMVLGFAMLAEIPLWLGLCAFLVSATRRARLGLPIASGLWLAFPLAAVASFWSPNFILQAEPWLVLVPLLLPPLFAGFAVWALGEERQRRQLVTAGFGAAVILLLGIFAIEYSREEARIEQGRRESEAELAGYEADFRKDLEAAKQVDGLLVHLGEEADRQTRALAAIRRLPSRQDDVVRLLESDRALPDLVRMHEFDLQITPALCQAYVRRLEALAPLFAAGNADPGEVGQQQTNIAWLAKGGCDLSAPVHRIAGILTQRDDEYARGVAASLDATVAR